MTITPPKFVELPHLPKDEDEAFKTIYALYGLAMFRAQVFEHEVINALFFLEFCPTAKMKHSSREQLQAAWEGYFEKRYLDTLGTLVRKLIKLQVIPKPLEAELQEARKMRDCLAHRFFREDDRDFGWINRERMEKMRGELVAATNLFIRADHALSSFMEPQKAKFGFSEAQVEKLAEFIKGRILEGHDE